MSDEGGDPACWLQNVCPECGLLVEGRLPGTCPRCGAPLTENGPVPGPRFSSASGHFSPSKSTDEGEK